MADFDCPNPAARGLDFRVGGRPQMDLAFIATGEYNTLENLRIMGVLQRLGICYGIVALLAVTVRHRLFPTIIAVLLVGYYLLQLFGNGFEKCAGNIVSMVDYAVLGKSHINSSIPKGY